MSSVSPIGPPQALASSNPNTSPITRAPSIVGPIGGIIGRPGSSIGLVYPSQSQSQMNHVGSSSGRSSSPPPRIFGSSALLEDDEIVEPSRSSSASSSAQWSSPSPFSTGIWGAPASGSANPPQQHQNVQQHQQHSQQHPQQQHNQQQQQLQQQQAVVAPDRGSVIRDRARVSFLKLDELSPNGGGGGAPIAIGDVHRALITLWPDSVSVE